ncbi:MAG: hypothetical protein IT364_14870, partial [Candidatus Hydrogenedentes bacterium]|nr:hypothetical protein [Candidatus Hydrogenedentota bacterium]
MPSTETAEAPQVTVPGVKKRPSLHSIDPWILVILAAFIFFGAAFTGLGVYKPVEQRIAGVDPVGYYAWGRSLLFDRDLQFANEYRSLNAGATFTPGFVMNPDGPRTTTGHLPNLFSIGPGLLWTPFIAGAHVWASVSGVPADGFSQPYHTAVFMANALYGILGVLLTYGTLRVWFPRSVSTVGALCAWSCSPALYYTYAQIAMAHACSFFAVALFLFAWARLRGSSSAIPWAVIGLSIGLAALIRWQNAAFAIIPALDLLARHRAKGITPLAACAAASIVAFLPQMIGWKLVYGSFFTVPQGEAFVDWLHPDWMGLLFSRASGLLTWTPLCAVAIAGLFIWPKANRACWIALAVAFLVQFYINSAVPSAGWSFGMRRMVNCTPLFAVGFAHVLTLLPSRRLVLCAIFSLFAFWNFLFVLQYGGFIDRYYIQRAAEAEANRVNLTVAEVLRSTTLPDGQAFDI